MKNELKKLYFIDERSRIASVNFQFSKIIGSTGLPLSKPELPDGTNHDELLYDDFDYKHVVGF